MQIVADLHTHTNVSHHAHSTLEEMIQGAKRAGHKAIAITNHGPGLGDGAHDWHFLSYHYFVPRVIDGIKVIRGAEANILDPDGRLDIPSCRIQQLDLIVASIHAETCLERDYDKLTNIMLNVLKNEDVNILGHMGSPLFKFDYEKIISHCNEFNKVVEINNNSSFSRRGSKENCTEIARLCKKYNVPISVNSDAHISYGVGRIEEAVKVIETADFPEELIVNSSMENLRNYLLKISGEDIDTWKEI